MCDQDDHVVPAHQVDDIDEVHELDPVHQVGHKDEHTSHDMTCERPIQYSRSAGQGLNTSGLGSVWNPWNPEDRGAETVEPQWAP